jgi:hypothetical protein
MELTMINNKFRSLTGMTWEEAATRSNQLFFEADKLDERAFLLLQKHRHVGPDVWAKFATTKRAAERKRAEARREWLRVTRILNSLDPKAGRPAKPISPTLH